ncbi:MAG: hypothetical protein NUW23_14435 [Firmicutes bacterium]|jgi:hypothetical protein|nr:hypothetical protein [Bacillota bacterium]
MASTVGGFDQGAVIARAMGTASDNSFNICFPVPIRVANQGYVFVRAIARKTAGKAATSFILHMVPGS